jgi:hypothetical protein
MSLFELGLTKQLYEAASYALFFALKHNFQITIKGELFNKAKESDDCVFLLLSYLH